MDYYFYHDPELGEVITPIESPDDEDRLGYRDFSLRDHRRRRGSRRRFPRPPQAPPVEHEERSTGPAERQAYSPPIEMGKRSKRRRRKRGDGLSQSADSRRANKHRRSFNSRHR